VGVHLEKELKITSHPTEFSYMTPSPYKNPPNKIKNKIHPTKSAYMTPSPYKNPPNKIKTKWSM